MNYNKIYKDLTKPNNRTRGSIYYEEHHIIPQCVGGLDNEENLVLLTAREHYIAHLLLTRIYENTEFHSALLWAYNGMCNWQNKNQKRNYKYNSRLYESLKGKYKHNEETLDKISKSAKEYYANSSEEIKKERRERMIKMWEEGILKGRKGSENAMFGKLHSEETKQKISEAGKGKKRSEKFSLKNSENNKGAKNSMALIIRIYNEKDELMFESNGGFAKMCKDNNLPKNAFYRSYNNNTKLFQTKDSYTRAKNKGLLEFKGWYALKD